jgi:ribonuclease D
MSIPITWIRSAEELCALADRLRGDGAIAIDSESDSLHHFPERVCLVQVATGTGAAWLVDTLSVRALYPLTPLLTDPAIPKIFHGASYDLTSMKRGFGLTFSGIFDTMLAAQFLGFPELGLDAVLTRALEVELRGPSRQKDDWGSRPLSAEQEQYAAADVIHLVQLRAVLLQGLMSCGRAAWVEEECAAMADMPPPVPQADPDAYMALKGARTLDRRGLAVLKALHEARDGWARASGRPPFKVLGAEAMVRLAAERPESAAGVGAIPGCSPKVVARSGAGILAAIAQGLAVSEDNLPEMPRPARPRMSPAARHRQDALLAWRTGAAGRVGLDPGILLPRRLIDRLAQSPPGDLAALADVEGIRRWRHGAFGSEILATLRGSRSGRRAAPGKTA